MSLAVALWLACAQAPADPAVSRVLVLDVGGSALSAEEAGALRDTLAAAVARRRRIEVLTSEDVRQVLDVEAARQAAGCEGESSCLAEIGAAFGADRVLYGTVARLGSRLVFSLSLVDPRDARAHGRDVSEPDSVEALARGVPDAVTRLFGKGRREAGSGSSRSPARWSPAWACSPPRAAALPPSCWPTPSKIPTPPAT